MKTIITENFKFKLADQIEYIAKDKPFAAQNFRKQLIKQIKEIHKLPYKNRRSIFFDDDIYRDLIYKGYIIIYKIDITNQTIIIFGFTKYEDNPFKKK